MLLETRRGLVMPKLFKKSRLMRLVRGSCAGLMLSMAVSPIASAHIFTDHFQGQGEACWGNLYIRTKTIEWDTDYSVCAGRYTVIKKTFAETPRNFDYILYKLKRVNRTCRYPYIGLYFYDVSDGPDIEGHWSVMGFSTFKLYQDLQFMSVLSGRAGAPDAVLHCNLPFYNTSGRVGAPY